MLRKKSSFNILFREMMVGENHYEVKTKGAFEC